MTVKLNIKNFLMKHEMWNMELESNVTALRLEAKEIMQSHPQTGLRVDVTDSLNQHP